MAAEEKWYFTKEQLANTPSRRCGCEADKELSNRQQAANFIQDMGQRLQVTQLCINTAIVYMHRFYVYHSFTHFHRNAIATAALFLAAKVEEQPRKLEHVIKVAHVCLRIEPTNLDTKSDNYLEQAQDLVFNENVLLQTLSFDVAIDHPHTHVVRCCHMVKASKDLAQTSYFMASNSLHLTTMCLQYKPTVVACFCIHLACKWSNWEIPQSNEGKDWFSYVDKSVTFEQLEQLTTEFLQIFDKCPTKLKRKIMSITASQNQIIPSQSGQTSQLFDNEPRKITETQHSRHPLLPSPDESARKASTTSANKAAPSATYKHSIEQYKEKKEKERMEREKLVSNVVPTPRDGHHPKLAPLPPHSSKPVVAGPSMAPPASLYRPGVTASRDQARRDQAHARELTKRDLPVSMFDGVNNHAPNVDLEANRHHSEKYNSAVKDNRHLDPSKRPAKPGEFNKYNHRKPDEATDALKRGFAPPPASNSGVRAPSKQLVVPPSHTKHHRVPSPGPPRTAAAPAHPSQLASHLQPPTTHSLPSSAASSHSHASQQRSISSNRISSTPAPPPGSRVPPPSRVQANQHGVLTANHRAPHPPRTPASSQPRPGSVKPEPTTSHHSKTDPNLLQRPHTDLTTQRPHTDVLSSTFKNHIEQMSSQRLHTDPNQVQRSHSESIASSHHIKTESMTVQRSHGEPMTVQRPHSEPMALSHHAKTEQILAQRSQTDIGRGLADAFRTDSVKPLVEQERQKPERETTPPPMSRPVKQEPVTPPTSRPIKDNSVTPPLSRTSRQENPVTPPMSRPIKQESVTPPLSRPIKENSVNSPLSRPIKQENSITPPLSRPIKQEPVMSPPISRPIKLENSVTLPLSRVNAQEGALARPPSPKSRPRLRRPQELLISPVGPMSPPLPVTPGKGLTPVPRATHASRTRTASSSSEPELVPYMKKIEEIAGYEHILAGRVPDIIQPIREPHRPAPHGNDADLGAVAFPSQANGSETDFIKTIIEPGKLLVMQSALAVPEPAESPTKHHKSEKKKKKEKKKHKEKDKDRPRDEKKKKKRKDKDKEKHRFEEVSAPIKITIPKEKILGSMIDINPPQGLKIKIHKDRLRVAEPLSQPSAVVSTGGLKLKISKDIIETYTTPMATKEARKRKPPVSDERPTKVARLQAPTPAPNGLRAQVEPTSGGTKSSTSSSKHAH